MSHGMTVIELRNYCNVQIAEGNGDKHIQITNDDEGNGYHSLSYQFTNDRTEIDSCIKHDMFHDEVNADEIILLG